MSERTISLPKPVGQVLSQLPPYPGSIMFVMALNATIKANIHEDVQETLYGKSLCVNITDAQVAFHFTWREGGFVAQWQRSHADLTISASAHDFLLLIQRKEDPDTLFFSRRLVMEGDTELGLIVKNTIDTFELPDFNLNKVAPHNAISELISKLKRHT